MKTYIHLTINQRSNIHEDKGCVATFNTKAEARAALVEIYKDAARNEEYRAKLHNPDYLTVSDRHPADGWKIRYYALYRVTPKKQK